MCWLAGDRSPSTSKFCTMRRVWKYELCGEVVLTFCALGVVVVEAGVEHQDYNPAAVAQDSGELLEALGRGLGGCSSGGCRAPGRMSPAS